MGSELGKAKAQSAKSHHRTGNCEAALYGYTGAGYEYLGASELQFTFASSNALKYLSYAGVCKADIESGAC
jgi:hypothetical protein